MVRIPVYDSTRPLNTGTEFFRQANTDAAERDITRGVGSIQQGLSDLSEVLMRQQTRDEKFKTEKLLIDAEMETRRTLDKEKENITETGSGHHDRVMGSVSKIVESTLANVPDSQRQAAELRLQKHLADTSDNLAKTEIGQSRNYIANVGKMKLEQITENVKGGAWTAERAKGEIDAFLNGIQLPPETTNIFRREMGRAAESGRLEYLRTNRPAEFMREVQRFTPNRASAAAGDMHRLIIENAKAYGVSPYHLLIMGGMESGFNPNATAKGSTARGLMGLTRGERARVGAMLGLNEQQMLDPAAQAAAGAIILKEAQKRLEANGIPVTATTLYANHFLGPGGALAMMRANPNADAYETYMSVAGPRIAALAFSTNPGLLERGMTVGQVMARINSRVEQRSAQSLRFVQADPEADTKGPITILGETFTHMTGADLVGQGVKATAAIVKQNDDMLGEAAKKRYVYGNSIPNVYDSKWRKEADEAAVLDNAQAAILGGDKDAHTRYGVFADRHGYLPKPVSAAVLALINSKDRAQQFAGYELAARVVRKNPTDGLQKSGLGGDTDAEGFNNAAKIRDYVNLTVHGGFGTSTEGMMEAMRRVELAHSPDFKSKERDASKDIADKTKARSFSEIESAMDLKKGGILGFGQTDVGPQHPALRRAMEDRYQEFFRFHYTEGRDVTIAKANAIVDMKRSYNDTRLFGKSYMMPMPPERNYPPAKPLPDGLKDISKLSDAQYKEYYGYIVDQAMAAARQRIDPKVRDKLTPADVVLLPDNLTKRDIEARELPRYTLAYRRGGEWFVAQREFRADPDLALARPLEVGEEAAMFGAAVAQGAGGAPKASDTPEQAAARNRLRSQRGQ
jgi:hypothetical protein